MIRLMTLMDYIMCSFNYNYTFLYTATFIEQLLIAWFNQSKSSLLMSQLNDGYYFPFLSSQRRRN